MRQRWNRGGAGRRLSADPAAVQRDVPRREHGAAPHDVPRSPGRTRALLFALFAASGFAGLVYESIWTHYLKLFLGHAAYAQTLVLAIFMGGMAIGAAAAARYTASIRKPLRTYAFIEAAIGILAIAFHPVFVGATGGFFDLALA